MGQVLDRAIRLYRQNFFAFIGIIAIVQIISAIAGVLLNYMQLGQTAIYSKSSTIPILGSLLAVVLVFISAFLLQIASAALTRAVADNYLGHKITIREAYSKIGRSWLSLIGSSILTGIFIFVFVLLFFIPCIGWLLAIPGIGGVSYISMVVLPFLAPIIVLEKQTATNAPGRAWNLARRRFWWLFAFALLLALFGQLVVSGPAYLTLALTTSLLFSGTIDPMVSAIIQQSVTFLFGVLYYPLQLTCITLMYFDVRIRTEGFDLALLAASDTESQKENIDISVGITTAKESITPTTEELGYFSLISIGSVLLFAIIWFIVVGVASLFMSTMGGF
jgi:hypothetical protein